MRLIPWGSAKLRSPTRSSLSTRDPILSLALYLSILACNKQEKKKKTEFPLQYKTDREISGCYREDEIRSSSDELTVEKEQICYKL